jgi:hypothetical protein
MLRSMKGSATAKLQLRGKASLWDCEAEIRYALLSAAVELPFQPDRDALDQDQLIKRDELRRSGNCGQKHETMMVYQ